MFKRIIQTWLFSRKKHCFIIYCFIIWSWCVKAGQSCWICIQLSQILSRSYYPLIAFEMHKNLMGRGTSVDRLAPQDLWHHVKILFTINYKKVKTQVYLIERDFPNTCFLYHDYFYFNRLLYKGLRSVDWKWYLHWRKNNNRKWN